MPTKNEIPTAHLPILPSLRRYESGALQSVGSIHRTLRLMKGLAPSIFSFDTNDQRWPPVVEAAQNYPYTIKVDAREYVQ